MGSEANRSGKPAYDRWLLLREKRNDVLDLWEVRRYGRDVFGDPDYVSIWAQATLLVRERRADPGAYSGGVHP